MTCTYKTAQIAKMFGIHPNTVRLYEELNLIPKPQRQSNGYRLFTELHIEQFKLARTALNVEVLQNGLRKKAIKIIKLSAEGKFQEALELTNHYLQQIRFELKNAEEAIRIVSQLLKDECYEVNELSLTRKEAADYLQITIDTLRNWEMNGLLTIKRKQNGYRIYTNKELQQLKIIRSLRCANYSLASILRMLHAFSHNPKVDIRNAIDTPHTNEDLVSACDRLLTSLNHAEQNALSLIVQLKLMQKKFTNIPF